MIKSPVKFTSCLHPVYILFTSCLHHILTGTRFDRSDDGEAPFRALERGPKYDITCNELAIRRSSVYQSKQLHLPVCLFKSVCPTCLSEHLPINGTYRSVCLTCVYARACLSSSSLRQVKLRLLLNPPVRSQHFRQTGGC